MRNSKETLGTKRPSIHDRYIGYIAFIYDSFDYENRYKAYHEAAEGKSEEDYLYAVCRPYGTADIVTIAVKTYMDFNKELDELSLDYGASLDYKAYTMPRTLPDAAE